MPTPPQLKTATLADLDILEPMVRDFHLLEGIKKTTEQRKDAITPLLTTPHLGIIWLLVAGDEVIGYLAVCFSYSIESGGRDCFIDEVYITPKARRKGYGKAALKLGCELLRAQNIVAIYLEVATDNQPARKLYQALGFEFRHKYSLMIQSIT